MDDSERPEPARAKRCCAAKRQGGLDGTTVALNRAARIAARGLQAPAGLVVVHGKGPTRLIGSFGMEGLPEPDADCLDLLSRAVAGTSGIAVGDARAVPDLAATSLVAPENGARFAVGVAVVDADLVESGAVWVMDTRVRPAGPEMISFLNDIAPLVADRLTPAVAEERARRAETRLSEAVEALSDGFVYFDAEDRLVLCNGRYRDMHARCLHALRPGARFEDILRAGLETGQFPEAAGREAAWLDEQLANHRRERSIVEQRHLDGRWLRIEEKTTASGGRVGLRVDISNLKRQQEALEEARTELSRKNDDLERQVQQRTATIAAQAAALEAALMEEREVTKAQRRFVAMISHEFRTPLAIIDASAGRIGRKGARAGADWVADYVQNIRGSVRRLVILIESVLGAAKVDAGTIELKPVELDLAALIAEICADQQRICPDREIRFGADLPVPVRADQSLVYQVLVNLVGNAVKYSPDGAPVEVAARIEEEDAVIDVIDRGVGIPEAELPKMFARFFRASTSTGIAGTGLGLNLSREIARMHGGDIGISSREGKGSTFTLRLRVAGPPDRKAGSETGAASDAA